MTRSKHTSLALVLSAALLGACGDDGGATSTSDGSTGGGSTGGGSNVTITASSTGPSTTDPSSSTTMDPVTTTMDPSTTTDDPTDSDTDSGTTGGSGCTQVTPEEFLFNSLDPNTGEVRFEAAPMAGTGDMMLPDTVRFSTFAPFNTTANIDFTMPPNDDLGTYAQWLIYLEDRNMMGVPARLYFPREGTASMAQFLRPINGEFEMTVAGVILEEVDTMTGEPVMDGECVEIVDGTLTTVVVAGWTCNSSFYGTDDGCDCGCGIADPDCNGDATVGGCGFCGNPGSCNDSFVDGSCPGIVTTDDNAVCTPAGNWTCDANAYADGTTCDCGCGVWDPDCDSYEAVACDSCNDANSCGGAGTVNCAGVINGTQNWLCTANAGWTCSDAAFDDAQDICDCGCGIADPDCADATVGSCDVCSRIGSCDQAYGGCMDTTVNAADNTICD